jgi:hypothetical protein
VAAALDQEPLDPEGRAQLGQRQRENDLGLLGE